MGKKVAIAGYGVEGKVSEQYWREKSKDVEIFDDNLDQFRNISEISDVDIIVRSPSVRPDVLPNNIEVTSLTKEFFKKCPAPIIAVTGTKGKGTTCTLIHKFLESAGIKSHLVGNIGKPALEELKQIKKDHVVVYEISSFQLWDLDIAPHVAVVLMMEPDHLDVHKDMDEYIEAKANITKHQTEEDFLFYHPTNEITAKVAHRGRATKRAYMKKATAHVEEGRIKFKDIDICELSEVALIGAHNIENICAAICASSIFVDDFSSYRLVLNSFKGLPHRLELVAEKNGVKYIDDSISTTPSTAMAAIKAFNNQKIIILGGSEKGSDYQELVKTVIEYDVKKVVAIGQTGKQIEQLLKDKEFNDVVHHTDFLEALIDARNSSEPGDVVLLSPASASFDMFKGYKDRGEQFRKIVESF